MGLTSTNTASPSISEFGYIIGVSGIYVEVAKALFLPDSDLRVRNICLTFGLQDPPEGKLPSKRTRRDPACGTKRADSRGILDPKPVIGSFFTEG